MSNQPGTYFPSGISEYVPAMQYAADMVDSEPGIYSLGKPALGVATSIGTGIAVTGTLGTETAFSGATSIAPEPFGRTITVQDSADPGAALGVVDVYGTDYLGQKMIERFTGVNGSAPIQVGKKAFKRINKVRLVTAATNAVTINIGWGLALGLPYKGIPTWWKEAGAVTAITIGTNWIVPIETDPATAITGDPRGTMKPAAAFDGVKEFVVALLGDPSVNAAGNGGLHGIRQFFA